MSHADPSAPKHKGGSLAQWALRAALLLLTLVAALAYALALEQRRACPCKPSVGWWDGLQRSLMPARSQSNRSAAIGSLKAISSAQDLFRAGDKEGDGVLDYGSLRELSQQDLVDRVLGGGIKQSHRFASQGDRFTWWATAEPIHPACTCQESFYVNQTGIVYYTTGSPIGPEGPALVGSHLTPLGR